MSGACLGSPWCTRFSPSITYHGGNCPARGDGMGDKSTKKTKQAEALIRGVDDRVAEAQGLLRRGEALLMGLEDRAASRARRRERAAQRRRP